MVYMINKQSPKKGLKNDFFKDTNLDQQVWMSHGDSLTKIPKGFKVLAKTKNKIPAAIYKKK